MTMMPKSHRFFWILDNQVPANVTGEYANAVASRPDSNLAQAVRLLQAQVPVLPQAYLTPAIGKLGSKPSREFFDEFGEVMQRMEELTKCRLGSEQYPLLLSVQGDLSGAVRNIGCSPRTLRGMVHQYGPAKAYTLYVDFLESYSTLVQGCPYVDFRSTFNIAAKREGGAGGLAALSEEEFLAKVREYCNIVAQRTGRAFSDKPEVHLTTAILHFAEAAKSAGGDQVFVKAQLHKVTFGQSVHGVAYTRDPFTGTQAVYGVFEPATSENKAPLESDTSNGAETKALRDQHPTTYGILKEYLPKIESVFRDIVEAEFVTDENGHLYFTGFDKGQKTAKATVVSAIELNRTGAIPDKEAALRIKPADIEVLLHPTLSDESKRKLEDLGSAGITAAPGTAVGHVFFKMSEAVEFYKNAAKKKEDNRVILITDELLIADTPGLVMVSGLVTKASGVASHAAVMARANGIPCIVGYKGLEIDLSANKMFVNGKPFGPGVLMTLEAGSEGRMYLGEGKLTNLSHQEGVVQSVVQLVNRVVKSEQIPLEIRVNINNSKDAATGLSFGADGVGLCRTENMFTKDEALWEIRNIVFTQDIAKSKASLERLEQLQFDDYTKIFQVMTGRTVNIRLMDMPLAELAPKNKEDLAELERRFGHLDKEHISAVGEGLKEHNPMLGLRACRFGLVTPEVYDMQIRAIVRAAYTVAEQGMEVLPGIMFPLVFTAEELKRMQSRVVAIEREIRDTLRVPANRRVHYKVGTMIELPAAALCADKLASVGEFFAFGTNDLTQTTLGISRDDSAHFLPTYIEKGVVQSDPFKVLSTPVKELIDIAVRRGRRVKREASFGICGEQGGDAETLTFCLTHDLNYVSASPFRVLSTKLALIHVAMQIRALQAHAQAMAGVHHGVTAAA
ncbi:MAG TPA: putative PEP-binding protein [Bdellovibrionota bacterium]|jgi:pyruvate,orthophosphate dikinase|nr:putative PEP-binding protein [Bdellovibrionota bacterium]